VKQILWNRKWRQHQGEVVVFADDGGGDDDDDDDAVTGI
jgi:hypothetical protein